MGSPRHRRGAKDPSVRGSFYRWPQDAPVAGGEGWCEESTQYMCVVGLVTVWAPGAPSGWGSLRVSVAPTSELFSRGAEELLYLPTNSQEEAASALRRRNVRTPDLCVCLTYKH